MRRGRSNLFSVAGLIFTAIAALPARAQNNQDQPQIPVHDLGDRDQDIVYPLTLTAQNLNCNSQQDFRFDLTQAPWIIALQDPVVRQLPPGGQGSVPAQLNFANTAPGVHDGLITIICETCGYIPFIKNCRADKQQVIIRVNIVLPPQPRPAAPQPTPAPPNQSPSPNPPGPTQGPQPTQPRNKHEFVGLDDLPGPASPGPSADDGECPVETEDVQVFTPSFNVGTERYLNGAQKNALDKARKAASEAAQALTAANQNLDNLSKKKRDCLDELEKLRADAAQKAAAASAAEAEAQAAQQAVDNGPAKDVENAQKAVDNYQKDVDAAQHEYDRWTEAAQRQQDYMEIVIDQEGGLSSKRGQNARQYYEEAAAKREAARKALQQVKNSMQARQAALAAAQKALAAAQKAADAKAAAAQTAREAANAANDAVAAKEKECSGLDGQIKSAEKAAKDAAAAVKAANKAAAKAEKEAKAQARKNLENALQCKKDECERIRKEWDKHFRQLTNAKKALEQIGYYKQRENARNAKPKEPDSLWGEYLKLGFEKFMEAASETAKAAFPDKFVPGAEVYNVLDVLQAAYGIFGIRQSALTPGTYAHGRTEGKTLHKWLQDNNYAWTDPGDKDAKEVEHQMERLMKDPNVIAKDLAQAIRAMENCKKQLAELEAKLAAANHR